MPLSLPSFADKAWAETVLKPFVDLIETAANTAKSRADSAYSLAEQKYTLPSGGVPRSSLASDVRLILNSALVWAPTSGSRPAGEQPTLWGDPTSDPGANARPGELWVGDVV